MHIHQCTLKINVYQVLAVNSLYVQFSCIVFTTANKIKLIHWHVHAHDTVVHVHTSDILVSF